MPAPCAGLVIATLITAATVATAAAIFIERLAIISHLPAVRRAATTGRPQRSWLRYGSIALIKESKWSVFLRDEICRTNNKSRIKGECTTWSTPIFTRFDLSDFVRNSQFKILFGTDAVAIPVDL
jgi:hypothetical protein